MRSAQATCLFGLLLALVLAPARGFGAPVLLLTLDGAVGPASADYVVRGIELAPRNGAQLVVLRMDTPGGLDVSIIAGDKS